VFEELTLDRGLRLGLDSLAFEEPTAVQSAVVPPALAGRDIHATAETGSGKTLAYLLPIAQHILAESDHAQEGTLALILVPTRELARQILKAARQLLKHTRLSVAGITGGADFKYQRALLRKDPEIVVATPGRLLEHCDKRSIALDALQTLVLDEADRMLDMGFRDDVLRIAAACSDTRQTMMLSATHGHGGVQNIAATLLRVPEVVMLKERQQAHSTIEHRLILADSEEHKDRLLVALTTGDEFKRLLVFANKRSTAIRLANLLKEHSVRCAALHGDLRTEQRKQVVAQFHDNKFDVLCASDVAARGLDLKAVDGVINYDMPRSGDDYTHRTGRTGRAGAAGVAITLLVAREWNLMISIQRYLGITFDRQTVPGLKARYSGPKQRKSDGRAAGKKKKPKTKSAKNARPAKRKPARARPGKSGKSNASNDGFAPLKKK
jgi:superfamily II DNA/RNA helicase